MPPTTEAVATSVIGTISAIPTTSSREITPFPNRAPSVPAAVAPAQQGQPKGFTPDPSDAATVVTASSDAIATLPTSIATAPTTTDPTRSDILPVAEAPPPLVVSSDGSLFTAPAVSAVPTAEPVLIPPGQSDGKRPSLPADPSSSNPTNTLLASLPSGGSSAGIIAPDKGPNDSPLTLPTNSSATIGGIVGGVVGGVVGLALIVGLLFFCLKKRNSSDGRWNEKEDGVPTFLDKVKSIPAGMGVYVAKLKGKKAGPVDNPYQRHTVQSSIGSVYSQSTNSRVRSARESQGLMGINRSGSARSSKNERNLLRKKQGSISSDYRFPPISEGMFRQDGGMDLNPFADPEPPKALALLNPDPRSLPVTPQAPPAIADPFASPLDRPGDDNELRKPAIPFHRRNISSVSALSSHPPSLSLPIEHPPEEPKDAPFAPIPATASSQNRQPFGAFNDLSTAASRDSNYTFFGEPGPSRPGTNLFTPGLPTGRTVRQSDPFDLDRPEVLGFGDVLGRREVRGSLMRQGTRSKRTSSVGQWMNAAQGSFGPYDRDSAKPRPLWSAGNQR